MQNSDGKKRRASGSRVSKRRSPVAAEQTVKHILHLLNGRALVFVGMMGAGKTTIGRHVARQLALPFVDSDAEVERASGMQIADLFQVYGESAFRDGEMKVIKRLVDHGGQVIATGGGAFVRDETRVYALEHAVCIWLKTDIDLILKRIKTTAHRPLLQVEDPRCVLEKLIMERRRFYEQAQLTYVVDDTAPMRTAVQVIDTVHEWLKEEAGLLHSGDETAGEQTL